MTIYPYSNSYTAFRQQIKANTNLTIHSQDQTILSLFKFLKENTGYQTKPSINNITRNDLSAFVDWRDRMNTALTTHNKLITHMKSYFNYLYSNNLIDNLPTINLKTEKLPEHSIKTPCENWVKLLPKIIEQDDISGLTKMILISIKVTGSRISEILKPNFYTILVDSELTTAEKKLIKQYTSSISDLQKIYDTNDLFLKKTATNGDFMMTRHAIYAHLKHDQPSIPFKLSPDSLRISIKTQGDLK